jgi:YD repeat-containing protein
MRRGLVIIACALACCAGPHLVRRDAERGLTLGYDRAGRLVLREHEEVRERFAYDRAGRLVSRSLRHPDEPLQEECIRWDASQESHPCIERVRVRYPGIYVVEESASYDYDRQGRVVAASYRLRSVGRIGRPGHAPPCERARTRWRWEGVPWPPSGRWDDDARRVIEWNRVPAAREGARWERILHTRWPA